MKKRHDESDEWFKIAVDDLECAHLLYQNKKYPQSIFYLQQANEKIAKGILIRCGAFKCNSLLSLANNGLEPKALEHDWGNRLNQKIKKVNSRFNLFQVGPSRLSPPIEFKIKNILMPNLKELDNVLNICAVINQPLDGRLRVQYAIDDDVKQSLMNKLREELIVDVLAAFSFLLAPHAVISRYPRQESTPIYNNNLPLIKRFNEIYDMHQKCLDLCNTL